VALAASARSYLTPGSTATVQVDPDVKAATPETHRLVVELSRPEFQELSRDLAVELLRARGFNLDQPSPQERQP
jgi:hypothetical protein